jgi:hypothetical protein
MNVEFRFFGGSSGALTKGPLFTSGLLKAACQQPAQLPPFSSA